MSPPVAEDRHNIFIRKKSETDMQPYNYTKTNMNNVIEKLFSGSHWHYTWSQPNLLCKFFRYKIFRLPWIFFGPVTCEHVSAYTTLLIPTEIDMHIRHRWSVCNSAALTTVHLMCLTLQSLAKADDGQLMLYLLTSKSRLPFSHLHNTRKIIPVSAWLITMVCKSPK